MKRTSSKSFIKDTEKSAALTAGCIGSLLRVLVEDSQAGLVKWKPNRLLFQAGVQSVQFELPACEVEQVNRRDVKSSAAQNSLVADN